MKVSELGERKLIEIIERMLEGEKFAIPFGDDVSAVEFGDKLIILKTDMLVDKTDVLPGMSWRQAGRKAVVMCVSDMASKGVKPIAFMCSIGVPPDMEEGDFRELCRGVVEGCREYGAQLLGGDTGESDDVVVACFCVGVCDKGGVVLRSGAKPGDIVAVTGAFGKTGAAFKILLEGYECPEDLKREILKAAYEPKARLEEGVKLAKSGAITASIDSSDGLVWSLYEISKASEVGIVLEEVPIAEEARKFAELHGLDPRGLALYGGEEYELVVTVDPEKWEGVASEVSLIRVGRVVEEPGIFLLERGERVPLRIKGYEHFKGS